MSSLESERYIFFFYKKYNLVWSWERWKIFQIDFETAANACIGVASETLQAGGDWQIVNAIFKTKKLPRKKNHCKRKQKIVLSKYHQIFAENLFCEIPKHNIYSGVNETNDMYA